jgi:hypothetical protein
MAKGPPRPPPNTPEVGDRCKLRGREATGKLISIGDRQWASVEWDTVKAGPRIVHLFELERI